MDTARRNKFLVHSAAEPMIVLRKRFHQGESLYKSVPKALTVDMALEDIDYVQYVLENAYSGYPYHEKSLFDSAFLSIKDTVSQRASITADALIDIISDRLSFICDGHLSFTTEDHGRGFYKRTTTFVSDVLLEHRDGRFIDVVTDKPVEVRGRASVFPTIAPDDRCLFLVGISSKEDETEIELLVNGASVRVPVHRIRSNEHAEETLLSEAYGEGLAVIRCGTFVGDSERELQNFKRVGEKCRSCRDVIWDLTDNLGGDSAFAEQFLLGLNGGFKRENVIRALNSSLVHAKEYGEVKELAYHFTDVDAPRYTGGDLFTGTLHVIINDGVASSGELAAVYASTLPHVVFYGCSTLGIGQFGDLCVYYLPNSNITLWCPQKVFNTVIPETEGMKPDFWIDSHDVVSAVTEHIRRSTHEKAEDV